MPVKSKLFVVEVEKGRRPPELTEETARSVASLQSHPGFLYLLAKLRFHQDVLKAQVSGVRQKSMEDVIMLQSGVAWSGWLKSELEAAINFQTAAPAPATQTEQSLFEEAQRQLEVLR